MAFFIEGQVIVQLTDFIRGWLFKPGCCLQKWQQFESTAIFRLCSWIWAVCANLAVVLSTALANRCWSSGLTFGDWLILWLKLSILFSKACSIHLHYAAHFTNNVRQSQAFNWVKPSNWSKLTKHRTTVRSEAVVGKSVRSGNSCANVICPNVWRNTHTKKS